MRVDVAFLPRDLDRSLVGQRAVVVFDVLRATTTMTAALAAGVQEIHIFGELEDARHAATGATGILVGEVNCRRPDGFDLGNSPAAFDRRHEGRAIFMCTTNGTRAIVAARQAQKCFVGALVNASAVGVELTQSGLDVVLLCAGTGGEVAMEDVIGAGAVIEGMRKASVAVVLDSDRARVAEGIFREARGDLAGALRDSQGGRNVMAAGLEEDLVFAARLDALTVVGEVRDEPLRVLASRG